MNEREYGGMCIWQDTRLDKHFHYCSANCGEIIIELTSIERCGKLSAMVRYYWH